MNNQPRDQFGDAIKRIENKLYNVHQPENSEESMRQKMLFQQGVSHISKSFHNTDSLSPMFQRKTPSQNDSDYYYYMIEKERNK
jgi:hypothetical protein